MAESLNIVIFGLSLTSSWGNGHATTYRALVRGLAELGHDVTFLEQDEPWYAQNRDLPIPDYARVLLYPNLKTARSNFTDVVRRADLVIVGSYVGEGIELGSWVTQVAHGVTAFYDIDTPVTLAKLATDTSSYLSRDLVPRYNLYLSFTGGPVLRFLENRFGARMARPLYCSVDSELYYPKAVTTRWDLGYMGTYSADRQPFLEKFLLQTAKQWRAGRFVVAGPQYPQDILWPSNVQRTIHVSPAEHSRFYAAQRFTLNLTRSEMRARGYSPSVRLFEAAACGTPIISDSWPGLEEFFVPDSEILVARSSADVLSYLEGIPERRRHSIARNARARVLREHAGIRRAAELIGYFKQVCGAACPSRNKRLAVRQISSPYARTSSSAAQD